MSTTVTSMPCRARWYAAAAPPGPAPTTSDVGLDRPLRSRAPRSPLRTRRACENFHKLQATVTRACSSVQRARLRRIAARAPGSRRRAVVPRRRRARARPAGTRASGTSSVEPLEPLAREQGAVLLVPRRHRRRAGRDARPASARRRPRRGRPASSIQSRPRSIRTRPAGRAARAPRSVSPTRVATQTRVLEPHEPPRRHVRAAVGADGRDPAGRHVAEGAPQRRRGPRSRASPPRRSPSVRERGAAAGVDHGRGRAPPPRRATSACTSSRVRPRRRSPSARSSSSWNAAPSGRAERRAARLHAPSAAPASAAPTSSGPSHRVRPALQRRQPSGASAPAPPGRGTGPPPSRAASGGSGRARAASALGRRTRAVEHSWSASTAARSPAKIATAEPTAGVAGAPGRRRRRLADVGGRPAALGRASSITSSWISAIVWSSSNAAAARRIGSPPSGAAGRAEPPVAEGGPQPLAPAPTSRASSSSGSSPRGCDRRARRGLAEELVETSSTRSRARSSMRGRRRRRGRPCAEYRSRRLPVGDAAYHGRDRRTCTR